MASKVLISHALPAVSPPPSQRVLPCPRSHVSTVCQKLASLQCTPELCVTESGMCLQADGSLHPSDDMEGDVHAPLLSDPALERLSVP